MIVQKMAVRVGFEPTDPRKGRQISSLVRLAKLRHLTLNYLANCDVYNLL